MKMANCDFVIKYNYRPCLVEGRKALWHRWTIRKEVVEPSILNGGHGGGQLSATFALVEFEDGTVAEVYPNKVRFLDSAKVFEEYDFSQQPKEETPDAEKIFYLLTDSKCPIYFLDNAHTYDAAKWLASKGVVISNTPNPPKEDKP